ncbi:MAG: response regulator [Candidatus Moranbacteria bacterium]|nr:response regulator [Candidatus Moranbacteria bacterium]MDQ5976564.1 two-component system, sensor histidine kinase and response regulator [Patescibacteria group bacterium]
MKYSRMSNQVRKILLIDDDTDIRGLYADVFRAEHYDIREASDGLEGLEMANQIVPDIIVSGIIMPRMDGFQLVEALRKNVATADVPVVFLSHLGREEDEARAKSLGVRDFIVQSIVTPTEGMKRVKSILENKEYCVNIDPHSLDAERLSRELGIDEDFRTPDGGKWVLRLRLRNLDKQQFDAELTAE